MAVRAKDLPLTPEQVASRTQRIGMVQTTAIRSTTAKKKWSELTSLEKDRVMKALAIHFGFVAPD